MNNIIIYINIYINFRCNKERGYGSPDIVLFIIHKKGKLQEQDQILHHFDLTFFS